MNEVTARILKYYKTLEERHNKEQEPITINNYVFPETHNMQGLREYQGTVFYKHKHTRVKHRYKLKFSG